FISVSQIKDCFPNSLAARDAQELNSLSPIHFKIQSVDVPRRQRVRGPAIATPVTFQKKLNYAGVSTTSSRQIKSFSIGTPLTGFRYQRRSFSRTMGATALSNQSDAYGAGADLRLAANQPRPHRLSREALPD